MNTFILKLADVFSESAWRRLSGSVAVLAIIVFLYTGALTGIAATNDAQEEIVIEERSVDYTIGTSTIVNEPVAGYSVGERVSNSSLYLRSEMENPTVRVQTTIPPEFTEDANASQTMFVRLAASSDEEVFWSREYPLDTVTGKDALHTEGKVPIERLYNDRIQVRDAFYGQPEFTSEVVVKTTFQTPDGERLTELIVPIRLTENTYSFLQSESDTSKPVSFSRVVTGTVSSFSLPILGTVAGLGGVVLLMLVLGRVSDPTRTEWDYHINKYQKEWLCGGEQPSQKPQQQIRLDSVESVVETAIDAGGRAVHVEDMQHVYTIVNETYYYTERSR